MDADSSRYSPASKDVDVEETFDCESKRHAQTSSGTRIRRYVVSITGCLLLTGIFSVHQFIDVRIHFGCAVQSSLINSHS